MTFLYSRRLWFRGTSFFILNTQYRWFTLGLFWALPLWFLSLVFVAWLSCSFISISSVILGGESFYIVFYLILLLLLGSFSSRVLVSIFSIGFLGPYLLGAIAYWAPSRLLFEAFVRKVLLDFFGVMVTFRTHLLRLRVGVRSPLFI